MGLTLWHIIRVAGPHLGGQVRVTSSRAQVHLSGQDPVFPVALLPPQTSSELHRGPGPVPGMERSETSFFPSPARAQMVCLCQSEAACSARCLTAITFKLH